MNNRVNFYDNVFSDSGVIEATKAILGWLRRDKQMSEWTLADIVNEFSFTPGNIHTALEMLVDLGCLTRLFGVYYEDSSGAKVPIKFYDFWFDIPQQINYAKKDYLIHDLIIMPHYFLPGDV